MAIEVQCAACGRALRVKDELAGKTVRCPDCRQPLRIPRSQPGAGPGTSPPAGAASARSRTSSDLPAQQAGTPSKSAAPPGSGSADRHEDALRKIELARQKRMLDAEADAAQRQATNELISSYDQLAGRDGPADGKAGKGRLAASQAGEKKAAVTAIGKAKDRFGMLRSSLFWKYFSAVVVLSGAAVGTRYLIGSMTTGIDRQVAEQPKDPARIPGLYFQAKVAADERKWTEVKQCLDEIIRIQPHRKNNIEYRELMKRYREAVGAGP
jgi:hypothetical protein